MSPTLLYHSGLSRPYLLYSPFYYSSLASPPLPTYPRTPILPLHSLPSAPLACPPLSPTLPYHIHPDRSRGRNVSFPTSTLTLSYSTLPYRPNTPLPYATHLLPTVPLLYPRIPSTPLIYHILLYPPLSSPTISSLLPPPIIPSPSVPYAPISSGLPCSTQRFKTVKGHDVLVPECIWRNCLIFWRTEMTFSLKGPGNVYGRNVLGTNRLWPDLYFCVTKPLAKWLPCNEMSIGRNGLVPKCLATEL